MAASALIDTGAILAILDSRDPWHNLCKAVFRQLRMPLLTSEAVLNELFHFTNANRGAMEAAWKFVRSGAMVVGPIPDAELAQISLSSSVVLAVTFRCGTGRAHYAGALF